MEFRVVNGGCPRVSRLCLGTMTFGSQTGESDARRMTDLCLDAGVNFFDTANVYNDGLSEEILGRCLEGRRDTVVLASKARGRMPGPPPYEGLSRVAIRRAIEESLRRLRTDYLDIYYLHQPDPAAPIEESLEALDELRQEGKILYTATSNYASWQIAEMFALCEKRGWPPPRVCQPMYNLLARGVEQEYLPFARRYGVSNVVYNPLAGGMLTGKQSAARGPEPGTRFDGNERYLERYWHDAYFEAVNELKAAATRAGRSLVEIALRWLLDRDGVDVVILGASRIEQLEANLRAAAGAPLAPETLEACDRAWRRVRGPAPEYNR